MTRGIERRRLFRRPRDYEDFLERLDLILPESGVVCWAWALLPNHVHLVLQRRHVSTSRVMARVNTGYAVGFNRRYRRAGYLFQNRFRSRLVQSTEDLVQLIRYVHVNPLAAGLVHDLASLETFPWCGHGALSGHAQPRAFHSVEETLKLFGSSTTAARRGLRTLMELELQNGGFYARSQREASGQPTPAELRSVANPEAERVPCTDLNSLLDRVSVRFGVSQSDLRSRSKRRVLVRARAVLCDTASRDLGMSGGDIARTLGIAESTVSRAIVQGRCLRLAIPEP